MIRAFEFAKPGWMKRFVVFDDDDRALLYQLTELAQTIGCSFKQLAGPYMSAEVFSGFAHYSLPEDATQFFLEVPVYYLNHHTEGQHLLGRRGA